MRFQAPLPRRLSQELTPFFRSTVGTPTLSTPSHISLLLHNLFNASIPSSQIPTSDYEFDPEASIPAIVLERRNAALPLKRLADEVAAKAAAEAEENKVDEDKAVGTTVEIEDEEGKEEEELEEQKEVEEEEEEEYAERGWWVHRKSREPLGGKEGRIEFTLVGCVLLFLLPFLPSCADQSSLRHA